MTQAINAFHPLYVKTFMPEFLTDLRTESRQTKAGQTLSQHVERKRETVPSHGTVHGISKKIIPAHMNRPKEMMQPKKTRSQLMTEIVAKKRASNKNYGTMLPDSLNIPSVKPNEIKKGKK